MGTVWRTRFLALAPGWTLASCGHKPSRDRDARIRSADVPHFIEELVDEEMRVVQEAITALGMIGPAAKDAIPKLEKLTQHDDPQIAERAKAALRQVRGRKRRRPQASTASANLAAARLPARPRTAPARQPRA